jgi:hypothetical protein
LACSICAGVNAIIRNGVPCVLSHVSTSAITCAGVVARAANAGSAAFAFW